MFKKKFTLEKVLSISDDTIINMITSDAYDNYVDDLFSKKPKFKIAIDKTRKELTASLYALLIEYVYLNQPEDKISRNGFVKMISVCSYEINDYLIDLFKSQEKFEKSVSKYLNNFKKHQEMHNFEANIIGYARDDYDPMIVNGFDAINSVLKNTYSIQEISKIKNAVQPKAGPRDEDFPTHELVKLHVDEYVQYLNTLRGRIKILY